MRSLFVLVVASACAAPEEPEVYVRVTDAGVITSEGCTCSPLSQVGCNLGEKCTWIVDHGPWPGGIGCAPRGPVVEGSACGYDNFGTDDCRRGAVCVVGMCRTICDPNGGAPGCDVGLTCSTIPHAFTDGMTSVAGACLP